MADPWAEFADAKGDPWREFDDAPVARPAVPLRPTGAVHDGDTFGLSSGANARLSGVDAFELAQVGRRRDGSLVPLGKDARGFLKGQVSPNSTVIDTGTRSYGRPVMMLENGGQDVGPSILRSGLGMATPQYLRDDPRLSTYMEAERFARQNRQGAFGTRFKAPWDYRRDPWSPAELSANGKGAATFWDEPTPFQGVRPEIAQGYIALAQDPKSTAADLMAYAKANGFTIDPKKAEQFIKARSQPGAKVSDQVTYEELPPVLTDSGEARSVPVSGGWSIPSTCSTSWAAWSMRSAGPKAAKASGIAIAASVTSCGATSIRTATFSDMTTPSTPMRGSAGNSRAGCWLLARQSRVSASVLPVRRFAQARAGLWRKRLPRRRCAAGLQLLAQSRVGWPGSVPGRDRLSSAFPLLLRVLASGLPLARERVSCFRISMQGRAGSCAPVVGMRGPNFRMPLPKVRAEAQTSMPPQV
jgi:endonuclease YncB( thermonuclease family)